MSRSTFLAHRATVVLMAIGVLVATGDGFAQSYAGLHAWAVEHHLSAWKADSFPLLVDLFIAVGELGLFALALEGHRLKRQGLAWVDLALPFGIAAAGWLVSLVFNVGAVGHAFSDRATAAVPPIASMLGLLVLLRTLHRLVTRPAGPDPIQLPLDGETWPLPVLAPVAESGPEPGGDDEADGYSLWDGIDPEPEPVPVAVLAVPENVLAQAQAEFAEDLAAGRIPGIRPIKKRLGVGQPRAKVLRAHLASLAAQ